MDSSVSHERERLAALKPALAIRARTIGAARRFFEARGYLELETPLRIPAPALELHIDAEPSGEAFLRTSPELHMKRLLAAGFDRIFQVGPCFRRGERGALHQPEFTMLEWYCANSDYMDILRETKALINFVALETLGSSRITFRDEGIALDCEWNIMSVFEAFRSLAGWDPVTGYDADRFDLDLVGKVEPSLPMDRPSVLKDYPAEAAALSRLKQDDPRVAERWELYIGRVEIANAFSELVDPVDQRRRFEECAEARRALGKPVYPLDEPFLAALEQGMPPSAGAALGIDRLVMILCGAASLDGVLPFR